jgi:hypothetical protein
MKVSYHLFEFYVNNTAPPLTSALGIDPRSLTFCKCASEFSAARRLILEIAQI